MNLKRNGFALAMLATLSTAAGAVLAEDVQSRPFSRIDFAPMPMQIYSQPGQKPVFVFVAPCIQVERMTHGFPPVVAFENFMFAWVGNLNASGMLPMQIEPVCS